MELNYERHDFDYSALEDACACDDICLSLASELADPSITHSRHHFLRRCLAARRRELAAEIADFRGLRVLGPLATGSNIINDLFSGKLPTVPPSPDPSSFDLGTAYTDNECHKAAAHSIGSRICETLSPYSFAAQSQFGGILDDAKVEHARRTSDQQPATPAPSQE